MATKILKIKVETEFVDEETGEITKDVREFKEDSVKKSKASSKKSISVDDNDPEPKLYLDSNKYILNGAAISALGVEVGDTIDIKNQKIGPAKVKVIGSSNVFGTQSGNKLTKAGSVSCRGRVNDELSKFGTIFVLTPHPNADGLFILNGDKEPEDTIPEPDIDNTVIDEEDISIDEEAVEISEDDFNFE